MPSRCFDCTFSKWSNLHQTKACNCGSYYFKPCFEDNSEEFYEKRADFCPIVEVPVPHGDLIDVDVLKNYIENDGHTEAFAMAQIGKEGKFFLMGNIIADIDEQPTIIEAEEME